MYASTHELFTKKLLSSYKPVMIPLVIYRDVTKLKQAFHVRVQIWRCHSQSAPSCSTPGRILAASVPDGACLPGS